MARGINQFTVQKFVLKESPELSYLLGVLKGDASLYKTTSKKNKDGSDYILQLAAIDKDFVEFFNNVLEKIFSRKAKIIEYTLEGSHFYRVNLRAREFYKWYYSKTEEELFKIAEAFPASFIKGVFDSEGSSASVNRKHKNKAYSYYSIRIISSNISLLGLINKWLKNYYEISSKINKRMPRDSFIKGRKCNFIKDIYCLGIYKNDDITAFFRLIGTSIKRKSIKGG